MEDNTRIRGIYTVCKFIVNNCSGKSKNRIITKTLGKFGVIDMDYTGPIPNYNEMWLVKIENETKCNEAAGCLVLTPIMPIPAYDVHTIIPGTGESTEEIENGICYVTPNNPNSYYIIPLEYRRPSKDIRFSICVHQGFNSKIKE